MSESEKYTSVQLVSKDSVLAYGDDYVKYVVDKLRRTISGKVLDRAELSDVIVSLKPMRITEQPFWDQVEYRLNVTVTDLVRCKDCKHYNAGFERLKEGYGIEYPQNWYCADGERREYETD